MKDLATILAEKDIALSEIKKEHVRQNDLLGKQYKNIKVNSIENPNLKEVLDGFVKHYASEKKEREQQYDALEHLMNYIEDLNDNKELSPSLINECNNDKHLLIREMQKIRNDIDRIIDK
jgi:hypothetical protein